MLTSSFNKFIHAKANFTYLLLGLNAIDNKCRNLGSSNFIAQSLTNFSQLDLTHCCMLFFHDDTASSVRIFVNETVSASL